MLFSALLSFFVACVFSQGPPCVFTGGPNNRYTLNLTSISGQHHEYKSPDGHNYYITPCTNGEICQQGNANFVANAVQYRPGENQCTHYLSVDHHERPEYLSLTASWAFRYSDGEKCDITQQPRQLNVYYLCDENIKSGAILSDVYEPEPCRYIAEFRTSLACIPESTRNANCQWRYRDSQNNTYNLDLSSQKGNYIRGDITSHGYEQFYSPCENGLHCYQQTGPNRMFQSILENRVTRTCELYLSEWQEGRVQPLFHNSDPNQIHWSFHYFLSSSCSNGAPGEETIRWYCDPSAVNTTLINATYDGNCRHEFNVVSKLACPSSMLQQKIL